MTDRFEYWWKHYPKKRAKQKARDAYNRQVRIITHSHPDEDPHDVLMAAVKRYVLSEEVKAGFVKHPPTWLNGGCWEDEYETPKDARAKSSKMDDTTKTELQRAATIKKMRCPTCKDYELTFIGRVTGKLQCCKRSCYEAA